MTCTCTAFIPIPTKRAEYRSRVSTILQKSWVVSRLIAKRRPLPLSHSSVAKDRLARCLVLGEILQIHTHGKNNLDKIYSLGGDQDAYGVIRAVEALQNGR